MMMMIVYYYYNAVVIVAHSTEATCGHGLNAQTVDTRGKT